MASRDVTFDCSCPSALADVDIAARKKPDKILRSFIFKKSGTRTVELEDGEYVVSIRVAGTPGTDFILKVTEGGKMIVFKREPLPLAEDVGEENAGRSAGDRLLTVAEDKE